MPGNKTSISFISLSTLVLNSTDQQGKLWSPQKCSHSKQPYNIVIVPNTRHKSMFSTLPAYSNSLNILHN